MVKYHCCPCLFLLLLSLSIGCELQRGHAWRGRSSYVGRELRRGRARPPQPHLKTPQEPWPAVRTLPRHQPAMAGRIPWSHTRTTPRPRPRRPNVPCPPLARRGLATTTPRVLHAIPVASPQSGRRDSPHRNGAIASQAHDSCPTAPEAWTSPQPR